MGDLVTPVKILLKAVETGIKLCNRLLESASSASTVKALQIRVSAPNARRSLEHTAQAIRDAYRQTLEACGSPFSQALLGDGASKRFSELKNDLRDTIDECEDFVDDPNSFEAESFACIESHSQKCCAACISIFDGIGTHILELRTAVPLERDDRRSLASIRAQGQVPTRKPTRKPLPPAILQAQAQPDTPTQSTTLYSQISPTEPAKPRTPWTINGAIQYGSTRQYSRDISPSSLPQISPATEQRQHIAKEVVRSQISANDEFLERRRQSKVVFQDELRRRSAPKSLGISSLELSPTTNRRISGTIDEHRASVEFGGQQPRRSPRLDNSVIVASPVDGRNTFMSPMSPASYEQVVSRERSLGLISQHAQHSRTSSFLSEAAAREDLQRNDSVHSQESIFGLRAAQSPPLSPLLSGPSRSGSINVQGLSATLKTPQFGQDVHEGIEVAGGAYDFSSEKIYVTTNDMPVSQGGLQRSTPTASLRSMDCQMRHDASFYLFRGFCEGAATAIRGRTGDGWYKIVKKPLGNYSATISAKCHKCSYEVGFNDVQKDKTLDLAGIYKNTSIRWRHRFLTKSHLRAQSINAGIYACVFCVEEHKTVEEHDATVFFSIQELFCHLAKHPQPLPRIAGINVIYGDQLNTVLDFDIHFTTSIPKIPQFCMAEIHHKVATRPAGHASTTYRPKPTSHDARDPDGLPVLHFAIGARIVGITFPERFEGELCSGYHNGLKGSFPATAIVLDSPPVDDYLMISKSTLVATAKWDFKPKDAKDAHWLKFSKGDRITCIGYTYIDSWCWSGQNSKGKWGIFPHAFVEGLVEANNFVATSPTPRSTFKLSGLGLGLGRKTSRQEKRSSTSSGNSAVLEGQPGLEVATRELRELREMREMRTVGS